MSLAAHTRLGPYEVLELIGSGGMGEVYRARDSRLQRTIAIKILPPAAAADPERLRLFEREERHVAALNHANVLAVYDVGTYEGRPYLVTELLEGQTLRTRLAAGPLTARSSVAIATQIAKGLAAAHTKGIVHRDVKPENLFITNDGTVKILDFGIARLTAPLETDGLSSATTQSASHLSAVGTVGYMAPEQARGQPADQTTDIFAFGCVLYEMLTGKRAFHGATPADTLAAILTKDPPPVDPVALDTSPALLEVVSRCLEKEPRDRFSSAHDLGLALEAIGDRQSVRRFRPAGWARQHWFAVSAATTAIVGAVAIIVWTIGSGPVLSFAPRDWVLVTDVDNQTGEHVFDKSLTAALVVSLEQSTHANVFPRTRLSDVLHRMGKADVSSIDEALGREICLREKLRGLISPAIAKVGQSYSLTARIIDPGTGDTVRAYIETASGPDAVLTALGSLAGRIRRDLGESLASIQVSNKSLPHVTTSSLEALNMYAQAREFWDKGKWNEAIQLYQSALKLDPDFAMAHAALGNAYYSHIYNNPTDGRSHFERAMQLSQRTTRREAQVIQIQFESDLKHFENARSGFEVYLKTYPDDTGMRYNYATLLRDHGDYKEAVAQYQTVLRTTPNDAKTLINLATSYTSLDQHNDALAAYARAFELEPGWMTSGNLNHEYGFEWVRVGDTAKAEEIFKKGIAASNKSLSTRSLALLAMYRGQYRRAADYLREAILLNESDKAPLSEARNELFLAVALQAVGKQTESTTALERAAARIKETTGQVWLTARIGVQYARANSLAKAGQMLEKARAEADLTNPQQSSDIHRLEGEIAVAHGSHAHGIELMLLADRENHWPLTVESLARAYQLQKDTAKEIPAYEALLAMSSRSVGWEAQEGWLAAHYWLADAYDRAGASAKAVATLDKLLTCWNGGDADLPLLVSAKRLHKELSRITPARRSVSGASER